MKTKTLTIASMLLLSALVLGACSGPMNALAEQAEGFVNQAETVAVQKIAKQAEAVSAQAADQQSSPAIQDESGLLAAYENTLTGVYEHVNPSVVFIGVVKDISAALGDQIPSLPDLPNLPEDLPNLPGLPEDQSPFNDGQPFASGLGSGFVWDTQGHIVTNNHVVEGANKIEVIFSDGTSLPATLVGADSYSDLAVIKVEDAGELLKPVTMGDSDKVKVGELAIAIGNPYGLSNTMTVGIISALGRSIPAGAASQFTAGQNFTIPDIIQTDAPINPGNSGGVLVNDQGEVVGVTTAIESTSGANAGIGFVVPAATVQKVVPTLIENGGFKHPYLGISGSTITREQTIAMGLDKNQRGALVNEVVTGGPADEAGLRGSNRESEIDGQQVPVGGDVIIAINGEEIKGMDELIAFLMGKTTVGETVTLTILRDGEQTQVEVTLAERPQQ